MSHLKEGTKLKQVYWAEGDFTVGGTIKSITVSMENGQMAAVPWALIEFDARECRAIGANTEAQLINLALCEGITLKEEEK